jgi:anaerobic magnesium-protoporphyrin IX monomethyl ester cyclase
VKRIKKRRRKTAGPDGNELTIGVLMRFRKVILISPLSSSRYGGLRVPAGIGYIAQVLQDHSIEYDCVDMRLGYTFGYLKKRLLDYRPDLIGISMITLEYKKIYRMISDIKDLLPNSKIVVGGHHITILREKALEECAEIDFGVVADGERTIIELCEDAKAYGEIKGLIFRDKTQPIFVGERPPVENLDEYGFPRYEKFNLRKYSKQVPVHSSRGCVFKCTFCPNKLLGRKYRTRSVNHFVDEMEYWYKKGYRQFAIDDDNFTLNRKRVFDICDEIERRSLKNLLIRCSNGVRADRVDRALLVRMKQIGVREVGFGVDGGNNKVLGYLKKGETIERIEEAIRIACELELDVKLFIIVGTPHETKADIEDSIRLAKKYPVARVNFNNAIPYPGTEMFNYASDHNLFLIPPEEYLNDVSEEKMVPVFETPELRKEERIEILKRCHQVEKEIMKNTVIRMFRNFPLIGIFAKLFFNVDLFEKLFFKSLFFRNIFEGIRYKKLLTR